MKPRERPPLSVEAATPHEGHLGSLVDLMKVEEGVEAIDQALVALRHEDPLRRAAVQTLVSDPGEVDAAFGHASLPLFGHVLAPRAVVELARDRPLGVFEEENFIG